MTVDWFAILNLVSTVIVVALGITLGAWLALRRLQRKDEGES